MCSKRIKNFFNILPTAHVTLQFSSHVIVKCTLKQWAIEGTSFKSIKKSRILGEEYAYRSG